ncbi:MAG TPA: glycosyltransferase family A protein [Patescibacteria group bacterium]|nr:glycosyltransferase family A protein [Patescibacteria group bacterium]
MKINNPKISVIIPTYNRANFLPRAIKSVLNQTFKDFELIIVDDGSTDNTKEVINNYLKNDDRIKYIYQQNSGGPPKPKNTGIKIAKGEYIAFLDSDDEWFKDKLKKTNRTL